MVLPQPGVAQDGLPGGVFVNIFLQIKYSIFAQYFYKQFVKNVVRLRPAPRAKARPCACAVSAACRPSSGFIPLFPLRMGAPGAAYSMARPRLQKDVFSCMCSAAEKIKKEPGLLGTASDCPRQGRGGGKSLIGDRQNKRPEQPEGAVPGA